LLISGTWLAGLWPGLDSPFAQRDVDRSQPALLRSLSDLHEYRAATGYFETIVDLERHTANVPSLLKGERTLFVAVGNVDAAVDFSRLDSRALDVSADHRSVTVTLPRARLLEPRVDPARSHVVDRQRGLVDRVESLFEDNPTSERELYVLAQRKLAAAARRSRAGPGEFRRAQHRHHARADAEGPWLRAGRGPLRIAPLARRASRQGVATRPLKLGRAAIPPEAPNVEGTGRSESHAPGRAGVR